MNTGRRGGSQNETSGSFQLATNNSTPECPLPAFSDVTSKIKFFLPLSYISPYVVLLFFFTKSGREIRYANLSPINRVILVQIILQGIVLNVI